MEEKDIKEIRQEFLTYIQGLVNYWGNIEGLSEPEKLQRLAFSILSLIDGCGNMPQFILAPNQGINLKGDISGALHEMFIRNF